MTTDEEFRRFAVLDVPEWYQPMSNSGGSCPWCENMSHWGHSADCVRADVVAIIEAALATPEPVA